MTPLFFFFTLCVSYAGADNCDYSWVVVDDLDSAGSYDPTTKTVHVSPYRISEVMTHEIKHIKCGLMYENDYTLDITFCNYTVDLEYTKQSIRNIPTSSPPTHPNTMSGKMIATLGLIGEVTNYSGNMKDGYEIKNDIQ